MSRVLRETAASAAFAFLAGVALWPPRAVYWTAVSAVVGDAITLTVVGAAAVGLGAAFAWATRVRPRPAVVGGVVAYGLGMAAIEALLAPDSPVHFVLYGGILACLAAGVLLRRRIDGDAVSTFDAG